MTKQSRNLLNRRFCIRSVAFLVGSAFLSGCMLVSGRRESLDARPEAGNTRVSFLSAEGDELGSIAVGPSFTTYEVIVIIAVEQGDLQLDVYDADGAAAITLKARPDEQVTRSANLASDERGNLRYRVTTHGARNGNYQILYRRKG
ncbi:MAG: hypothetical protein SH847_19810 [Roseiflexaceae bacterium]|nr:hypothetical protein [Roseiflexaceae bacterium]